MSFDQKNDGIDHINIYSKGQTKLGRYLSNFTREPFECEDGKFYSIEGYWYWLGCRNDKLRYLSGYWAKKFGREVGAKDWLETEEFKDKIRKAMEIKIEINEFFHNEFKESNLPFTHYYMFGTKIIEVPEAQWILDHWEKMRNNGKTS